MMIVRQKILSTIMLKNVKLQLVIAEICQDRNLSSKEYYKMMCSKIVFTSRYDENTL